MLAGACALPDVWGCSARSRAHSEMSWRRALSGCNSRRVHHAYQALRSLKYARRVCARRQSTRNAETNRQNGSSSSSGTPSSPRGSRSTAATGSAGAGAGADGSTPTPSSPMSISVPPDGEL